MASVGVVRRRRGDRHRHGLRQPVRRVVRVRRLACDGSASVTLSLPKSCGDRRIYTHGVIQLQDAYDGRTVFEEDYPCKLVVRQCAGSVRGGALRGIAQRAITCAKAKAIVRAGRVPRLSGRTYTRPSVRVSPYPCRRFCARQPPAADHLQGIDPPVRALPRDSQLLDPCTNAAQPPRGWRTRPAPARARRLQDQADVLVNRDDREPPGSSPSLRRAPTSADSDSESMKLTSARSTTTACCRLERLREPRPQLVAPTGRPTHPRHDQRAGPVRRYCGDHRARLVHRLLGHGISRCLKRRC